MPDLYQFTEEDIALMRELVEAHRNKKLPLRSRSEDLDHQAPETYVVRIPTGGIEGASEGLLTGTGAEGLVDDSFSSETCQAYRVSSSGIPVSAGPALKVYNFSTGSISGDVWALVTRDKWGRWFAIDSSGTAKSHHVKLTGSGTGVDNGTAWKGLIQKEVAGVVIDNGEIGTGDNPYVMYATKAEDGSTGVPQVNDIVIAIPDPLLSGRWEFRPKKASTAADALCHGCGWLADIPKCVVVGEEVKGLTAINLGGNGRCACVQAEDPATTVIKTKWDTDLSGWVRGEMVHTCCGCGLLLITENVTDPTKPHVYIKGLHTSCLADGTGPENDNPDYELVQDCCGIDPLTGEYFANYIGYGPVVCNDDPDCGSFFTIQLRCGECLGNLCNLCCAEEGAPYSWKGGPYAQFTNYNLRGWWVWKAVLGGLPKWQGVCTEGGPITSTLEYVETVPPVYRLTHGTEVYEKVASSWFCCSTNVLDWVSGSDATPLATMTINPVGGNNSCGECSLPDTFVVSTSFAGCAPIDGLNQTVTRIGATNVWEFDNSPTLLVRQHCVNGQWQIFITTDGCSGTGAGATTVGPPTSSSSSPFQLTWTGVVSVGTCCSGTGTVTVTL